MKLTYPIVFSQGENYILAHSPDFNVDTEGNDLADAMFMAADAISLTAIAMEDRGITIPQPSPLETVSCKADEHVYPVIVDFEEYRRKNDQRAVRKNVTIPAYLEYAAEQAGLNFSRVLQDALKKELGLV